ncbi:hypothetical protein Ancab_021510 [Ancistrocladus abbreviatus]
MTDIFNIPSQYILKHWTRDAKHREISRQSLVVIESRLQCYRDICQLAFKLGDEGSFSPKCYNITCNAIREDLRKCETVNNSTQNALSPGRARNFAPNELNEVNQGKRTTEPSRKCNASEKNEGQLSTMASVQNSHLATQQDVHALGIYGSGDFQVKPCALG